MERKRGQRTGLLDKSSLLRYNLQRGTDNRRTSHVTEQTNDAKKKKMCLWRPIQRTERHWDFQYEITLFNTEEVVPEAI